MPGETQAEGAIGTAIEIAAGLQEFGSGFGLQAFERVHLGLQGVQFGYDAFHAWVHFSSRCFVTLAMSRFTSSYSCSERNAAFGNQ